MQRKAGPQCAVLMGPVVPGDGGDDGTDQSARRTSVLAGTVADEDPESKCDAVANPPLRADPLPSRRATSTARCQVVQSGQ